MIGTVIKSCFHTNNRIGSKRSFQNTFLKSFFHCWEVVLRNSSAYNYLLELIWCFQITGRCKTHFNMTILSVSAGLFFVLSFHIRILADRLTERNLWFRKLNVNLITVFQFIYNNIKMLIAHTVKKCLSVGRIIFCTESLILTCHFCKSLRNFILIALLNCFISLAGIRSRDHSLRIKNRCSLGSKAVACLYAVQLGNGTDVTCMKFRNLIRLGAFQNIQLIQALFLSFFYIEKCIIGFDNTGSNLDKGIFADKRVNNGFPYICGFRFGKIIICLKDLICLLGNSVARTFIRAWEISADIIQKVGYAS